MKLRNPLSAAALLLCTLFIATAARAGETGHYVCGMEGIKLSSAPPPGFYYKLYNAFYYCDEFKSRRNSPQVRPDIQNFVMVHRPIWITEKKLFGADYFFDVIIPITYADVSIKNSDVRDEAWALADLCLEPLGLAWHAGQWDVMSTLALYVPTGNQSLRRPALPGKDFWTLMLSQGATRYLDAQRTWAVSAMLRYELNSRKRDENIRPGQVFSIDASLSKTLGDFWDFGISGYAQVQTTRDRGGDIYYDRNVRDRVFALGPEFGVYVPFLKLKFQFRTQAEFGAVDRTQGIITNFSFTKSF